MRNFLVIFFAATMLAGCGGSNAPVAPPPPAGQQPGLQAGSSWERANQLCAAQTGFCDQNCMARYCSCVYSAAASRWGTVDNCRAQNCLEQLRQQPMQAGQYAPTNGQYGGQYGQYGGGLSVVDSCWQGAQGMQQYGGQPQYQQPYGGQPQYPQPQYQQPQYQPQYQQPQYQPQYQQPQYQPQYQQPQANNTWGSNW